MWMPLGWVSASGGGTTASYELISTTVLGSSTPSVTFNLTAAQQAAYKHLQLRMVHNESVTNSTVLGTFNGDTGSNYNGHRLTGDGTNATSGAFGTRTSMVLAADTDLTTNSFGVSIVDMLDVFSTSKYKTVRVLDGFTGSASKVDLKSMLWMSTSAVSSITLTSSAGNFVTASRFSLYGVR